MYKIKFKDGTVKEFESLFGADLRGADLSIANLSNADLLCANLTGAKLPESLMFIKEGNVELLFDKDTGSLLINRWKKIG